jgi:outer membrane protein assembly factor BamB
MSRTLMFIILAATAGTVTLAATMGVLLKVRSTQVEAANPSAGQSGKKQAPTPDLSKQHRPKPPPADAWPMFRGAPHLAGVAAGTLSDQMERLWSFKTGGQVSSSAAIVEGRVFVGSDDCNLYALSLADGKKLWAFKTEGDVGSSPCVAAGTVYVGDQDGILYAVDAATGKEKWRYKTEAKIPGSPVAVPAPQGGGSWILVGSFDNRLHCVDGTGKLVWTYNAGQPINGAPAFQDGKIYFGGCDGCLHEVSFADGTGDVCCEAGAPIPGSASVFEKRAYFGQHTDRVIAADLQHGGTAWTYHDRDFAYFSTPAIADGKIFIGGDDKRLHALYTSNGKSAWTFSTKGKIGGSPVVCGSRVYFGSNDGRVYGVDLDTGKQAWSYEIGQEVQASPAIAAGRLVIGSDDGSVYCFGEKE